mmetsp:Transcript_52751/g.120217  ORF Transcript_52751/g.120217 Transcript_52751/m.120217 type:complete len:149 (+) Transcript_52751:150-596(+)
MGFPLALLPVADLSPVAFCRATHRRPKCDSLALCPPPATLQKVARIHECEVYSYTPDMEDDPFSQFGSLWSFNYFFFNRGLKRIMYFTCIAKSRFTPQTPSGDGGFDEGDEVGDGYRPGDRGGFGGGGFFGAMDEEPSDLNGDYEDEA